MSVVEIELVGKRLSKSLKEKRELDLAVVPQRGNIQLLATNVPEWKHDAIFRDAEVLSFNLYSGGKFLGNEDFPINIFLRAGDKLRLTEITINYDDFRKTRYV